jgi:hypothetical protein
MAAGVEGEVDGEGEGEGESETVPPLSPGAEAAMVGVSGAGVSEAESAGALMEFSLFSMLSSSAQTGCRHDELSKKIAVKIVNSHNLNLEDD